MRVIGRVLLGLGVFLLVLAPLMRFYAYPKLANAPADQTLRIVSTGPDANVLNTRTFTNYKTDLTATRLVQGDVDAAEKQGGNTDVWQSTVSTVDSTGHVLSRTIERAAFNANTSESVNCCGEFVSTTKGVETPVRHTGIVFKFPFNTQQQTYSFWDLTLAKAFPMVYQDTESIDGVRVYKFVQTIKPTRAASPSSSTPTPSTCPAPGNVTGQTYYSNVRTVWVEPNTGVILKGQEQQYNTIRAEGADRVVTTAVTITYSPASVQMLADTYGSKGEQLHRIRTVLPLIALIAGLVLVVVGALLALLGRPSDGARHKPTGPAAVEPAAEVGPVDEPAAEPAEPVGPVDETTAEPAAEPATEPATE